MQTSRLLVSSDFPHLILAVETSLQKLLGYAPHELVGKDIRILQGPGTDTGPLTSSLAHANVMQSPIVLYERHGLAVLMDVSCEHYFSISQNQTCTLMGLTASETTPHHALGDSAFPHAPAAEWHHHIDVDNRQYPQEVGVAEQADRVPPPSYAGSGWHAPSAGALNAAPAATPAAARGLQWLASMGTPPAGEGASAAIARDRRRGATPLIIDDGYVRRLRRRYQAAARRRSAPKSPAAGAQPARCSSAVSAGPPAGPCCCAASAAPPPPGAPLGLCSAGSSRESSPAPPSPPSPSRPSLHRDPWRGC